ncbi:FtsX-like permease family protein [Flavobacteriaceae bacterium]|nr:FtsX-like permease family protein [Flavobacteriaceae bacterium]
MHIAIGTGVGFQNKIKDKISSFEGHLRVSTYESNATNATLEGIDSQLITSNVETKDIAFVNPVAYASTVFKTDKQFTGGLLKGIDSTYQWNAFEDYLIDGRLPVIGATTSREILVSKHIAKTLGVTTGDRVSSFFLFEDRLPIRRSFVVSGLYDSGFPDFDQRIAFADLRHIQKIYQWESHLVGALEMTLTDFDDIETLSENVYDQVPAPYDLQNVKDRYPEIFNWISLFDTNIALIVMIMIIVGGINMITALLVLILERTQMIGLLGVLGMQQWSTQKVFLYNAGYLIGIGLFWGNLLGLGLLFIQHQTAWITLDPTSYYVTTVPIAFDVSMIAAINIGTFVICLLMLLIPSFIISKVTPIRALRRV